VCINISVAREGLLVYARSRRSRSDPRRLGNSNRPHLSRDDIDWYGGTSLSDQPPVPTRKRSAKFLWGLSLKPSRNKGIGSRSGSTIKSDGRLGGRCNASQIPPLLIWSLFILATRSLEPPIGISLASIIRD
jgi:hypothetical protein